MPGREPTCRAVTSALQVIRGGNMSYSSFGTYVTIILIKSNFSSRSVARKGEHRKGLKGLCVILGRRPCIIRLPQAAELGGERRRTRVFYRQGAERVIMPLKSFHWWTFREEGSKREKEKKTSVWERSIDHRCPDQGSNPQPRYVPWPRMELETFLVCGTMSQPSEIPSQGTFMMWGKNPDEIADFCWCDKWINNNS